MRAAAAVEAFARQHGGGIVASYPLSRLRRASGRTGLSWRRRRQRLGRPKRPFSLPSWIDHDYVAHVTLQSTGGRDKKSVEFHNLEFAISLPSAKASDDATPSTNGGGHRPIRRNASSNLVQRTNIALRLEDATDTEMWRMVPGDLVAHWRPNHFDTRFGNPTARQIEECSFYQESGFCKRTPSQIAAQGRVAECRPHGTLGG